MKEMKMTIEKEFTLKPLVSGHSMTSFPGKENGRLYYEQILMYDEEWPLALVHIDTFWPGRREGNPTKLYAIHDALNEGRTVKVRVRFDIIDEDNPRDTSPTASE